jgi:hypothetical protein
MKKVVLAILSILYLATSTGATINMHYCMGKLAGWGIGHEPAKKCGKCGMKKVNKEANGCCKDEQKFIKNTSDQKTTDQAIHTIFLVSAALPPDFTEYNNVEFFSIALNNPTSHAPPEDTGTAIYIRNCVFLI